MANLKITQTRSVIGTKQNHRDTLRTLGLKRVNDVAVRESNAVVLGQLHTVRHLITVEEVD
jgi:large subunit ribosomal protein L30